MPDLNIAFVEQCSDLNPDFIWTVGSYQQTSFRGKITCSCKGFQYRKTCKHVKEVEKTKCSWHSEFSEERQKKKGVCPVCGNETETVQFAV